MKEVEKKSACAWNPDQIKGETFWGEKYAVEVSAEDPDTIFFLKKEGANFEVMDEMFEVPCLCYEFAEEEVKILRSRPQAVDFWVDRMQRELYLESQFPEGRNDRWEVAGETFHDSAANHVLSHIKEPGEYDLEEFEMPELDGTMGRYGIEHLKHRLDEIIRLGKVPPEQLHALWRIFYDIRRSVAAAAGQLSFEFAGDTGDCSYIKGLDENFLLRFLGIPGDAERIMQYETERIGKIYRDIREELVKYFAEGARR